MQGVAARERKKGKEKDSIAFLLPRIYGVAQLDGLKARGINKIGGGGEECVEEQRIRGRA